MCAGRPARRGTERRGGKVRGRRAAPLADSPCRPPPRVAPVDQRPPSNQNAFPSNPRTPSPRILDSSCDSALRSTHR